MFKEVADIKTSDQLHLPVPETKFETVVVQPSEYQKDMVASLSERAADVHAGIVDPSVDNILGISRTSAYNLVKKKVFHSVRIGGSIRISKKSFDEWLDHQM